MRAEEKLVAACMAEQGLTYRPATWAAADPATFRPFGAESAADRPAAVESEREQPEGADPRYRQALYGDPDRRVTARGDRITVTAAATGCQADAERRLLGAHRQRQMQLRILLWEAESRALGRFATDPGFAPVRTGWRDCMRTAGFPGADDPAALPPGPAVAADLACKQRLAYLPQAYAKMAELQLAELAGRPGVLAEWDSLERIQIAAAQATLDS